MQPTVTREQAEGAARFLDQAITKLDMKGLSLIECNTLTQAISVLLAFTKPAAPMPAPEADSAAKPTEAKATKK